MTIMKAEEYFAIQNLLNRYFQFVDSGDFESCGELFAAADLIYTQSGTVFSKDPAGVAAQMRSFVKLYGEDKTPKTLHQSSNFIIEGRDDHHANTSCAAVIYQGTDALPFQAIAAARYQDELEKRKGRWIITQRRMSLNFMGDLSHHLLKETSK